MTTIYCWELYFYEYEHMEEEDTIRKNYIKRENAIADAPKYLLETLTHGALEEYFDEFNAELTRMISSVGPNDEVVTVRGSKFDDNNIRFHLKRIVFEDEGR